MKTESLPWNITIFLYLLILLFPANFYLAYHLSGSVEKSSLVMKDVGRLGGALESVKRSGVVDPASAAYIEELFQRIDREFMQKEAGQTNFGFHNPADTFRELYAKWKVCKYGMSDAKKEFRACLKDYERFSMAVSSRLQGEREGTLYILYALLVVTLFIIALIVYIMRIDMSHESGKHALMDSLTGLYNRSYFLEEIKHASARASRTLQPLSIIAFGIDDFENITLDKRDPLLIAFGAFLSPLIRSSDIACRVSENQFVVIAPDTEVEKVKILAVRLRKAVEKKHLMAEAPVTISVGGSQYENGEKSDEFVRRAEVKWREAKEFKNRVILDK